MMRPNIMTEPLPFPTKPLVINGVKVGEEYLIPDENKAEVLKRLYIFHPVPDLDDVQEDLHTCKRFKVREFRVVREDGLTLLVSPFYEEGGGTVTDWLPVRRKRKSAKSNRQTCA